MIDIVLPNNNEAEFLLMAKNLGFNGVIFLYSLKEYLDRSQTNNIKGIETEKKFKTYNGILADNKDINKTKNTLKNHKAFIAVRSSYDDREVIEKRKANLIFSFEDNPKRDAMHQRYSGLNHILCKLAYNNNIIIGFSLKIVLDSKNKPLIMGRIMQNIMLCRKFKVNTIAASFANTPLQMRSPHDIRSLFEALGNKNISFYSGEHK
ncbi:hypothetical protein HYX01_01390 [Candidatus Woesearchaeota archaeon]|nr:hypothetical protein [Candidatus Woesearchaeota archaeon]